MFEMPDPRLEDIARATHTLRQLAASTSTLGDKDAKSVYSRVFKQLKLRALDSNDVVEALATALSSDVAAYGYGYSHGQGPLDRVLCRVMALIGQKLAVSADAPGLTGADALVYFVLVCRVCE